MTKTHSHQLILGLTHGDSRTWAAARQRLNLIPPKRRARMRYMDEFAEQRHQASIPVPYLHSTHESILNPVGPADVSEWFAVSLLSSLGVSLGGSMASPTSIWQELSEIRDQDPSAVRGRLGTTIALDVIARSGSTATSGKDNPHYFDDLSLIRAMAVAVTSETSLDTSDRIEKELSITASDDGLVAGIAMGNLTVALLTGASPKTAINNLVASLAHDSWTLSVIKQSLDLARQASSIDELAFMLEKEIADHVYSYQVSAPETLAMACAYLAFSTTRDQLLLGGFLNASRSEVLVPLLWGLAGVQYGGFDSSPGPLQGLSVRALRGIDLNEMYLDLDFSDSLERKNNNG